VLTLNNDLTVKSNYLNQLMMAMEQHPNSILGSVSVDSRNHDKVCFAGVTWNKWTAKYIQNVNEYSTLNEIKNQERLIITDLLPGRGTLIPIEAFKIVGVYNEKTFPHYAADEHFSLSCKKSGFQLFIVPNAIVYSEVEATGLKNIYKSKNRKYWIDLFSSRRSAVNLKTRWNWAKYNTPIPPLYFIFDLARIVGSQLKSK
jgi:GT2 family glycosyltransferase